MIRLAVTGATGRMGRRVREAVADRDDADVVLAVNRDASEQGVEAATDLPALLDAREPAVLVDFTGPSSAVGYVETAAEMGVAVVTGTTGFDEADRDRLRAAAADVAVCHAANFSRGIGALREALVAALSQVPEYDAEVIETHHARKRDAPSGTAASLVQTVEDVVGDRRRVSGREGEALREDNEVGVHAVRAGDVTGEHAVVLAGDGEVLRLGHRVDDRSTFAAGAVDAAVSLAGRPPGWYDLDDLRGDPETETRTEPGPAGPADADEGVNR